MDNSELKKFLDAVNQIHVLCVGDIMLDYFVEGKVERVSPEAPVPVMRHSSSTSMLGGIGNVARNVVSLGATATVVSVIGKDNSADILNSICREKEITAQFIQDAYRPTTTKTRYASAGQHLLRVDREIDAPISNEIMSKIIQAFNQAVVDCDIIVLSDYEKGVMVPQLVASIIKTAKQAGKPVIIDPKGHNYQKYRGANILTPNLRELKIATNCDTSNELDVIKATKKMMAETECDSVLLTRGKRGMTLASKGSSDITNISTVAREVFDVSGAGDTVAATLALAYACGASTFNAAKLANLAGGIVVTKVGTAVVTTSELEIAHGNHRNDDTSTKLMSTEKAVQYVKQLQRQSLIVGFTNGCFDLLHPGHVSLLQQARSKCDRLIVGLNTDRSVKRLKGQSRPIQDERSRSTVLAALSFVDALVLFNEDTPYELIKLLKPDLLVKGADYTIDQVVGAEIVQSYGGKIELIDLVPEQSTTNMLKRSA